jgi:hypothetical protein
MHPKNTSKSNGDIFTVVTSSSPLIKHTPKPSWALLSEENQPHPYFQYMPCLDLLASKTTLTTVALSIQSYKLYIITYASYNYNTNQGSHVMAITTGIDLLWLNPGPCMRNGITMNPKGAELCSLTTALYLSLWICCTLNIHYGSIAFLCDSKLTIKLLSNTAQNLPSANPTNNIDLIIECPEILQQLPIRTMFQWLQGHSKGECYLCSIQRKVHDTAKQFNTITKICPHILPPSYEVAVSINGKLIPTNIRWHRQKRAHSEDPCNKIIKDTTCTVKQFEDIDWIAHEKAYIASG